MFNRYYIKKPFYFVEAQYRMAQLKVVSTIGVDLLQRSQPEITPIVERPQCQETADDVCKSCKHGWRNANLKSKLFVMKNEIINSE